MKTLVQFISEKQAEYPDATGDFTRLMNDIGIAAKIVNREIRRAGLADINGYFGSTNIQGEEIITEDQYEHPESKQADQGEKARIKRFNRHYQLGRPFLSSGSRPMWREPRVIVISCWLANTASSAGVYFLARWRGREFFESGWRRRLMPPEAMGAISSAYARHGMLGIFLSRFLPGVRAAVTPFAGVVGMPPLRALVPAATASGLWYAAIVLAGATLSRSWQTVRSAVDEANRALGIVSLVAAGVFAWWLWTKLRRTR